MHQQIKSILGYISQVCLIKLGLKVIIIVVGGAALVVHESGATGSVGVVEAVELCGGPGVGADVGRVDVVAPVVVAADVAEGGDEREVVGAAPAVAQLI